MSLSPKRLFRIFIRALGWFLVLLLLLLVVYGISIYIPAPKINSSITPLSFTRKQIAKDSYAIKNCWLKKNNYGIWEMYLEGSPYERGVIYGVLAKELIEKQEEDFVYQINTLVPNKMYQFFLKGMIAWFNRDIYKYIPEENLQEIYGISLSFSDKYDYVGPKYYRILNYHAAHDIGHALNDYSLVGCTSFAVNKEFSADSSLLLARNFDFYLGDAFAKEKLLVFVKPDSGYKYASYSWAGFTGVVSGMNEKGITVTINAAKSDIPYASREPISLLAREILQYSKNINDAVAIAKKRETFVSESLLIGSAEDDKAIIIEKSPQKFDVYSSGSNFLVCPNHYQGEVFMRDSNNLQNIKMSDSHFRYERIKELASKKVPVSYSSAIEILRNKNAAGEKNIGYGNPKSINQLIAHHSIAFKPQQLKMWVSTAPYQLGKFVCYDLSKVFSSNADFINDSLTVPEDNFMYSTDYKNYELNKITKQQIRKYVMMGIPFSLNEKSEKDFIAENPKSYITYMTLGDYFKKKKQYNKAMNYYGQALVYDVASENEKEIIKKNIFDCAKELQKQ